MSASKDILKQRAVRMAKPLHSSTTTGEGKIYIAFVLASETFALEASFVKEVFFLNELTPLPGAPPHLLGIVNLRGSVIALLNFKAIVGLHEYGLSQMNNVLVVNGMGMEFGIVADAISGTRHLSDATIGPPPVWKGDNAAAFISGITIDGIIVLDAANVIQHISKLQPLTNRKTTQHE